ncbi:hypothetical protein [Krasilnikovia sp. M28-CT-15]|uniref:hypothetical protein n=1 Tax=Krasilnikovia sp. M28-CT-15 TaxID=3373540 RepID=UPI00399C89DD
MGLLINDCFRAWLVGQPQADLAVQLGLVGRVSVAEQPEQVGERVGDGVELVACHPLRWRLGEAEPGLGASLEGGGLADPAGDECRVATGVERRLVATDLGVGLGDGPVQLFDLAGGVVGGEGARYCASAMRRRLSVSVDPVSSARRNRSIGSVMASSRSLSAGGWLIWCWRTKSRLAVQR